MATMASIPRSRGGVCGLALVLLGAWGALIPFVGPYFHYGFTPDRAWAYTEGRLVLSAVPGVIALLAGLIIALTRSRGLGGVSGFVAALAGGWFIAGGAVIAMLPGLFPAGKVSPGAPIQTGLRLSVLTGLSFFAGAGALIVFFAALAIGRFSMLSARDADTAAVPAAAGLGYDAYAGGQFAAVPSQYPAGAAAGADAGYAAPGQPDYQSSQEQPTTVREQPQQDYHRFGARPDAPGGYDAPGQQDFPTRQDIPAQHEGPASPEHHAAPGYSGGQDYAAGPDPITHDQFGATQRRATPGPPFPPAPDPFTGAEPTRTPEQHDPPPAPGRY